MPELPEAETIARQIWACAAGKKLLSFDILREDYITACTKPPFGEKIVSCIRSGKKVVASFSNGTAALFSLGMSGNIYWRDKGYEPIKHTHLILGFEDGELHVVDVRRFGNVFLGRTEDVGDYLKDKQGPDVLEISDKEFVSRFERRTAPIKPLLLDQRIVAGIGNIYADEALFKARIHPLAKIGDLEFGDLTRLHNKLVAVLAHAIELGGSTISTYAQVDGSAGYFQIMHQVYGKSGENCPECGAVIERLVVRGRSSHVCPKCQGENDE